ncbi:hypothetical protein DFJ73DRAFT_861171 [Zopfochytrium polystomum]|nr:hypothetical protein DFJ73DRAFT_861171 [Zopfochytrium polystomum]
MLLRFLRAIQMIYRRGSLIRLVFFWTAASFQGPRTMPYSILCSRVRSSSLVKSFLSVAIDIVQTGEGTTRAARTCRIHFGLAGGRPDPIRVPVPKQDVVAAAARPRHA